MSATPIIPPTVILMEAETPSPEERALQASLQLPLVHSQSGEFATAAFSLFYGPQGLSLQQLGPGAPGPIRVDFTQDSLQRRSRDSLKKQNLSKAVGIKGEPRPAVLDATAGFGLDAFLMALQGCTVTMLERSPIVHALLADGLRRAAEDAGLAEIVQHMELHAWDFVAEAASLKPHDVVYLDPMFPSRNKQAKAKKGMAVLQELLGENSDEAALLATAQRLARLRVVVKRPRLAPVLAGAEPSLVFKGSSSRFDVYLSQ